MILVTQRNDNYEIRFQYDPDLIEIVKSVPTRMWDPNNKVWTIHKSKLGFLLAHLSGTKYESEVQLQSNEHINVNAEIESTQSIPNIDTSDVPWTVSKGMTLFEHQKDAVKYDKWRNEHNWKTGFILADQPGMGKTLSVTNIALYHKKKYKCKHCLIIPCVNSAKFNWKEDIIKHTNGKEVPYILGSRIKRDGSVRMPDGSKEKLDDLVSGKMYNKTDKLPFFLILNIEAVRMKDGRKYPLADQLIKLIDSGYIGMVILDEVHKGTSPSSLQGKQLIRIRKSIKQKIEWIPMTGTPITSKPTDVFLPLFLVGGHNEKSFYKWCETYCIYGGFGGKEIIGYRNIPQLKQILQPNMLRRLKDDVLDLPPKIHHTEYIENTNYQDKLYKEVASDLKKQKGTILKGLNPLSQFLRLRQVNGSPELVDTSLVVDRNYLSKNAKLSRLLELVDEIVENGEKVVIFSNWVEPLRTLYRFVSAKYKVCCYTGTMSQEDREKHKKAFIENPDYKVMIGTVQALGTSHTLSVARNIIFYDSPWNPSDREQCEDRCHRPGTTQTVNIYTLIVKDTVDETVHNILSRKEGTSEYIVDNKLDLKNHPELFDLLMGT